MKKNQWIGIMVALAVVFIFFGFLIWNNSYEDVSLQEEVTDTTMTQNKGSLIIEDVVVGDGVEAGVGDLVSVHYTGTFVDGVKFDSSLDRGQPIQFVLGTGYVIQGWDQGLIGMKVGGKRKLTISPELAYGSVARGNIPANSTLLFDVELIEVQAPSQIPN